MSKNIFFESEGPFKLSVLFPEHSKSTLKIKDIKTLNEAKKFDLTFFDSLSYQSLAEKTNASSCITKESLKKYLPNSCEAICVKNVLFELASLNYRLRELAVQKLNDTMSVADKAAIAAEEAEIVSAGEKIANTELNNRDLLSTFTVAINNNGTLSQLGAVVKPVLAAGVSNADTQMANISKALGQVAAGINALKGHQSNMYSLSANARAAASRIQDTDFAKESANLAQSSILNQSALAMVAQANKASAAILTLLN